MKLYSRGARSPDVPRRGGVLAGGEWHGRFRSTERAGEGDFVTETCGEAQQTWWRSRRCRGTPVLGQSLAGVDVCGRRWRSMMPTSICGRKQPRKRVKRRATQQGREREWREGSGSSGLAGGGGRCRRTGRFSGDPCARPGGWMFSGMGAKGRGRGGVLVGHREGRRSWQ